MMDWDSDPELKAMRDEFVESFRERRAALSGVLASSAPDAERLAELRLIAHKLAGAAESYGFPSLTRAGAAIDDVISLEPGGADPEAAARFARLLDEMLADALARRADPADFGADPRYRELICAAESLASAAKS